MYNTHSVVKNILEVNTFSKMCFFIYNFFLTQNFKCLQVLMILVLDGSVSFDVLYKYQLV